MIKGQCKMVQWVVVSTEWPPFMVQWKNDKIFVTLQKVKTTSLVDNFSILVNCWNHDQRSMSKGSISFGVHKWGQGKFNVKTTGLVHNFIIPANCWNDDCRSKSNGSMTYGVHRKMFQMHRWMYWLKLLLGWILLFSDFRPTAPKWLWTLRNEAIPRPPPLECNLIHSVELHNKNGVFKKILHPQSILPSVRTDAQMDAITRSLPSYTGWTKKQT